MNYCNNLRIFRYAETLLNYVELVKMDGVAEQQGVDVFDIEIDEKDPEKFCETVEKIAPTFGSRAKALAIATRCF